MADEFDPNPELRAEYEAVLAKLNPQRRGYTEIRAAAVAVGGPPDEIAAIDRRIASGASRHAAITFALASLDAVITARRKLRDDGYPTTTASQLDQALFETMQGQASDYDAALAMFQPLAQAVSADLTFGQPEPAPTTPPPGE